MQRRPGMAPFSQARLADVLLLELALPPFSTRPSPRDL